MVVDFMNKLNLNLLDTECGPMLIIIIIIMVNRKGGFRLANDRVRPLPLQFNETIVLDTMISRLVHTY